MSDYKRKMSHDNHQQGNYYQKKRSKQFTLQVGMRGFLCTCNFREKDCIRDAYKLLGDFADKLNLLLPEQESQGKAQESVEMVEKVQQKHEEESEKAEEDVPSEEEDISTALSKEIDALKAESKKSLKERKFQAVDTGAKNVVFIKTGLSDPLQLALPIMKQLEETRKSLSRFILRLVPVQVVCKAYMDDMTLKADQLFDTFFVQEPKTFAIVFNRHSNNSIKRDQVITAFASLIGQKNAANKADLKNPDLAVVVEVIRGYCLLSVAPDYFKYKKYNLLELCGIKDDKKSDEPKEGGGDAVGDGGSRQGVVEPAKAEEAEASNKEKLSAKESEEKEEKESDTAEHE